MRQVLLLIIVSWFTGGLCAQPLLPSVAGATERGVVLLSWQCQYDGIKTIAVRRSRESSYNYKIIGYVKNLAKGPQAFADGHPEPGSNYYKLYIIFNSGLSWTSNYCEVKVDSAVLEERDIEMPPNDSLQRYLDISGTPIRPMVDIAASRHVQDHTPHEVTFTFDMATSVPPGSATGAGYIEHRKIKLALPKEDVTEPTFIHSRYVTVLHATGHVQLTLPADHPGHLFSIRFYSSNGKLRVDVPDIAGPVVILDKRNFQHKGTYRFVLKRDGVEFESGYIVVNP